MPLDRTEIQTNTPALIRHIRDNYNVNRPPAIVEPIQNSQDEYANRLADGTLDDGRTLRITFRVNVDEGYAEITDNAGGMTRSVMSDVVPEIDTTSSQKSGGGNVGSEGRGLFAVAASTEKLYIETLNTDGERLATILFPDDGTTLPAPVHPRDIAADPDEDVIQDAPQLSGPEGTLLKLHGLDDSTLNTLSNWDTVENVLAELFTPLFSRDDVELIYMIEEDGEVTRYTPSFAGLDSLMAEELERIPEHEFTVHGEDYVLKDVVFGRAAGSYPWDGIAFFKGNNYFDGPVMMVDHYNTQVESLTGDPEMIAWCRIDECAELEDPSHQKLNIRKGKTDLRQVTQRIHAEHFAEESASDEQEINRLLRDTVNQAVNDLNDEYFQDFATIAEHGAITVEDTTGEDALRSDDDGSLLALNPNEYPESHGPIAVETRVYPPETPEFDNYVVHDITITGDPLNASLELDDTILLSAIPDEIQTSEFTWTAEDSGYYRITASISGVPEGTDPVEFTPDASDVIDEGLLILPVDVDPRGTQSPTGGGDGGSGPGGDSDGDSDGDGSGDQDTTETATIFNEINEIASGDSQVFAKAFLDGSGGFTVNLNKAHPKWREIYRNANREEERKRKHQDFGSKKIARAVIEELKFVQLEQAADQAGDVDDLLDEAFEIRQEHEEIYAEIESNVEHIVTEQ